MLDCLPEDDKVCPRHLSIRVGPNVGGYLTSGQYAKKLVTF